MPRHSKFNGIQSPKYPTSAIMTEDRIKDQLNHMDIELEHAIEERRMLDRRISKLKEDISSLIKHVN